MLQTAYFKRLTQHTISITITDANGNPVNNGSAAVVITDVGSNSIVLTSTNMPFVSNGKYSYTIAAAIFIAGSILNIVMTGKDVAAVVIVTSTIQALDGE